MKYVRVIIDNTSNHTDNFYTYACEEDGYSRGQRYGFLSDGETG